MFYNFIHANADFVTGFLAVGGDLEPNTDAAAAQAIELADTAGITDVLDVRLELNDGDVWECLPEVSYHWDGMDDAGQQVPPEWWDGVTEWAISAITAGGRVLVHCHMGINRSPSVVFAILLTVGWEPVDAMTAIRSARPIANAWYAEQALDWHLNRTQTPPDAARRIRRQVAAWRRENPLDVLRVIGDIRNRRSDR